jgi:hypothetical protein
MKTIQKIQTAAIIVALLVAVKLADSMEPTTNELIGSVTLTITGGTSLIGMLVKNENRPE